MAAEDPKTDQPSPDSAPPESGTKSLREGTAISSSKLIGCRLGDFQVLRKLGRGGMADVYAARQLSLGRDVAMKVLRSDFARDDGYVARFRREAKAAAKLNHPNIVQVYEVGNADSYQYIAQELVDGENLREVLTRRGALSIDEAIEVLVGVGSALELATEAGITHRDIKPENIMRSSRGMIKVADFGLARLDADVDATRANLTQAGLTLGTPRYMSPEQVQGHTADVRSDLYSLGITMYHLLAGRAPFEADDPLALAVMHLHETPPPLDRIRGAQDIPEWLAAIVLKLIHKRPQDRFQSPSDLLSAVRQRALDAGYSGGATIGTAAATIRLQRVSDSVRQRRKTLLWRWTALLFAPILSAALMLGVMLSRPSKSITAILKPAQTPMAATIDEQYLIAATRNDEAGWLAVAEYFSPKDSAVNAAYYAKSMLQLARLYMASENRLQEADQVLEKLLSDPRVDSLYRSLALVQRCRVAEQTGDRAKLTEAQTLLISAYSEMQTNNRQAASLFERLVPEKERLQWGLKTLPSIDS